MQAMNQMLVEIHVFFHFFVMLFTYKQFSVAVKQNIAHYFSLCWLLSLDSINTAKVQGS